jgi:hypothetical protein
MWRLATYYCALDTFKVQWIPSRHCIWTDSAAYFLALESHSITSQFCTAVSPVSVQPDAGYHVTISCMLFPHSVHFTKSTFMAHNLSGWCTLLTWFSKLRHIFAVNMQALCSVIHPITQVLDDVPIFVWDVLRCESNPYVNSLKSILKILAANLYYRLLVTFFTIGLFALLVWLCSFLLCHYRCGTFS